MDELADAGGLPLLVLIHSLLVHQTLLGNYPMVIRWLAHRYLLKQSLSFYSNDFAGRIATKVMQTSLAVRETVMKLLDVLVYVLVYFTSMVVMVAQSDWRMMLPMLAWLLIYIGIQYYFVPKLKRVSTAQAESRSMMTGRIVDSYTNIQKKYIDVLNRFDKMSEKQRNERFESLMIKLEK